MSNLVYPELSFRIVGSAFRVFNAVGYGLPEKYCQAVYAEELKKQGIIFEREYYVTLNFGDIVVKKYYLDFFIEDKVAVELKVSPRFGYVHIKQVMAYLKATNCKLAIIIYFCPDGVKYRRIINNYQD